jgi:DNA-binding Lrp family transcriptional regulator
LEEIKIIPTQFESMGEVIKGNFVIPKGDGPFLGICKPDLLSQKEFCREISQHPFVQEVFVLSGQYDVFLKIRTKDVEEMNRFIVDFLRELPAVERTLTMFVMDSFLETQQLRKLTDAEYSE